MITDLLDALIPPLDELPGGSIAEAALLAEPEIAALLEAFDSRHSNPLSAWQRLVAAQPSGTSALLHLLSAAYFAHPDVRSHYGLDTRGRLEPQPRRLAELLAQVPPAPRLPER
jgi:hypothetical protein